MIIGIILAIVMIPIGIRLGGLLLDNALMSVIKSTFDGKPTADLKLLVVAVVAWIVIEGFLVIRIFQLVN